MPVLDFFLNDISPVTKNLRFDVGATLPVLRVRVMDGNDPVDLTGATATFTMKDKDGNVKILNAAAIVEGDGSSGIVRYEWTIADTDVARIYFAQFTITLSGEDLIVPNDADQVLRIVMGKSDFQRGTVIEQPVAQGIQVVALGGTPTLDAIGRWFKVVVSALDFTDAAVEESIDLFQLPPGGIVEAIKAKHSEAFSGGAISAYTVEVGSASQAQKYMSAFDVFSAPTATNHKVATSGDEESHDAATPIKVTAKATGGDVGDGTVGTVEIWIKASTVLGSGGLLFSDGISVQDDGAGVAGGPFKIFNFKDFALVADEDGGIVGITAPAGGVILLGATSLAIYSDNLVGPTTESDLGSKAIDIQSDRTLSTQIVSGVEAIGIGARVTVAAASAIGIGRDVSIDATHTRSVAIGDAAATTAADQIMLGTAARTVVILGTLSLSKMTDVDGMEIADFGVTASTTRLLKDVGGTTVIDFGSDGSQTQLLSGGNVAVDWACRKLVDSSSQEVMDWDSQRLIDASGVDALNWNARQLFDNGGGSILDWSRSSGDALHVQSFPLALDDISDPGSVPVGSVIIFAESGSLKARTSSGVTTLAV